MNETITTTTGETLQVNTINDDIKPDFTPERLQDESFDDYKLRRKAIKKWISRSTFIKNEDDHNRDFYRGKFMVDKSRITSASRLSIGKPFKARFRATKKLKEVRGKFLYGDQNVSAAIRNGMNPVSFIQYKMLRDIQSKMPSREGELKNAIDNNIIV